MSGFNANFRNAHDGSQSNFNGAADQRGSGNPGQIIPPVDGFLTLECGDTVDSVITDISPYSFFRTQDVIANTRYRARQANMVVDVPGRVTVTVTTGAFTPFISIFRTADDYVISSDGSGEASIDVTVENEGPLTIEVTSIEPYARGDFTIHVSCGEDIPTTTVVTSSLNPCVYLDPIVYTATVTADLATPTGNVIFSDDSGELGTSTLVAGVATLAIATQAVGTHTVTAAYQGDPGFEPSQGTLDELVLNAGDLHHGCPVWPSGPFQVDETTVNAFNDNYGHAFTGTLVKVQGSPFGPGCFYPTYVEVEPALGGEMFLSIYDINMFNIEINFAGGFGTLRSIDSMSNLDPRGSYSYFAGFGFLDSPTHTFIT